MSLSRFADVLEPVNPAQAIHAADPHPLLTPITADGVTNDSVALAAQLAYLGSIGGGRLDVRMPGQRIKCNSGLTIPAGVQLYSDESTLLDFSGIGTGTAITVNDEDFTPLVGVHLEGPNSTASLANTSVGISVTGIGLRFYNTRVKYFGRGVDLAHSDTFIITFVGGDIGGCGTCVYADFEAVSASNAGERITVEHFTLYNSARALNVTGNGTGFYLTNCSIDFCTEFGRILNSYIFLTGCHLESTGNGTTSYLFDVQGNSHVFMSNTGVIMGGGAGGLYNLFNPSNGPSNYGFGLARFSNVSVFYVNPSSVSDVVFSDHMYSWPASTTSQNYHTPFPLRWCAVAADFCTTDGYTQLNTDQVQITAMGGSASTFTLTTPSNANQRWVRVRF